MIIIIASSADVTLMDGRQAKCASPAYFLDTFSTKYDSARAAKLATDAIFCPDISASPEIIVPLIPR